MKILRSILLAAIGVVLIVLGTNDANLTSTYTVCEMGKGRTDTWIKEEHNEMKELLFILGGATLIVCAIPTNLKRKKED